ncbi:hypothetical protein AVEN_164758-1 [Araneus ventricosus]|uniref:Transposase IS30-like HTH domain-containing protein n=1 Tax=Araneus ventricosus TaxID=182803 RepID=A0A4Y2DRJ3_ARAVE|nr:hypothetical protein AVEN_164758-1 [Araneus ventricosus]
MAGYQDLSNFERGRIIGAREMGHSISEIAKKFGYSHTAISRVYHKYRVSGKTSNLRHRRDQEKTLKERDRRRPRETLNELDVQHFLKLLQISMLGH